MPRLPRWLRPLVLTGLLLGGLLPAGPGVFAQALAPIPPLDAPVVDTTGTLGQAQKQQLVQQALDLQQRKGSQLQVLMVPTTQPEDIAQYTQRVFDQVRLGRKGIDDGVLLVIAKDDRRVRIQPGYGLEGAIPDAIANRIIQEYIVPKFREDDYAGGIGDATAMLVKLIDGEPLPAPMADNRGRDGDKGPLLFGLFVAFVIATVARGLFGWLPAPLRTLVVAGAAGYVAWFATSLLLAGGLGVVVGLLMGLARPGRMRAAGASGWGGGWGGGGGGWGGGGFGGGGGGGWSGGGGMSGGGGASGSW